MSSRYYNAAENAEKLAVGAGMAGVFSWFWETLHVFFGWATSAHVLATISVMVAITSSLLGLYYRRQEEARATRREMRELEIHKVKLQRLKLTEEEQCRLLALENKEEI